MGFKFRSDSKAHILHHGDFWWTYWHVSRPPLSSMQAWLWFFHMKLPTLPFHSTQNESYMRRDWIEVLRSRIWPRGRSKSLSLHIPKDEGSIPSSSLTMPFPEFPASCSWETDNLLYRKVLQQKPVWKKSVIKWYRL